MEALVIDEVSSATVEQVPPTPQSPAGPSRGADVCTEMWALVRVTARRHELGSQRGFGRGSCGAAVEKVPHTGPRGAGGGTCSLASVVADIQRGSVCGARMGRPGVICHQIFCQRRTDLLRERQSVPWLAYRLPDIVRHCSQACGVGSVAARLQLRCSQCSSRALLGHWSANAQ